MFIHLAPLAPTLILISFMAIAWGLIPHKDIKTIEISAAEVEKCVSRSISFKIFKNVLFFCFYLEKTNRNIFDIFGIEPEPNRNE